ncbi:MAG: dihydrofolate reductase family protein, partial [Actinomycetota bacterium]|nr:dihydrofolate reductase family protein [Actinomycetota bacterium]
MRQLFPTPVPAVDPAAVYRHEPPPAERTRPRVVVNMVASVDGATVAEGVTEGLSSPADKRIFFLLRSLADVILVGAQTVRAEGYGPARVAADAMAARRERGQSPAPRVAVVSRSLHLDWSARLFTDTTVRPLVIAPAAADPARLADAERVADVVV